MSKDNITYVRRIKIHNNIWLGINSDGWIYMLEYDAPYPNRIIEANILTTNTKDDITHLIDALKQALTSVLR